MKIAIMTRAFHETEGPGIASMNLVDKLLEIDRDNQYVIFHQDPQYCGRYTNYPNIKEILIKIKSKIIYDQLIVPWLSRREGVDLIFNTKFSVPLLSSIDSITIIRGSEYWIFPEYYDMLDLFYVNQFVPRYCKKAQKVITLSDVLKKDLHKYLGVPLEKMVTIYSAAHERFTEVTEKSKLYETRRKYGLPNERFVLSVTRPYSTVDSKSKKLYPRKNIHGILQSFMECTKRLQENVALVLIGKNIKETLLSNGYELNFLENNNFIFIGSVVQEDMPAIYTLAELLIFPSYYESFGLPLIEAMRCGCPVVTSDAGACPEIVADSALMAGPDDISGLSDAMFEILSDQNRAEELRRKGLQRAQEFVWEKSARALKALFENYKSV